ncbi:hypothetical protein ACIOTI_03810 [Streptomyces sp. NPDC087843]|uniref:hypothetical protein n=1 Tax=Streptomyces sp. NPDC087843 TaxID=3365804 RepID=UPI003804BE01
MASMVLPALSVRDSPVHLGGRLGSGDTVTLGEDGGPRQQWPLRTYLPVSH